MGEMEWPGELVKPDEDAEVWIIDPEVPATAEVLELYTSLKVIFTASTGTNHIDLDYCDTRGIEVYSLLDDRDGLNEIRASSEFTFFLILAGLRRLNRLAFPLYSKGWHRNEDAMRGNELYGKTVGIVGMGRIGQNIYKWCYSFGANPKYLCDPPAGYAHTLEEVFQNSDIVVISCALTEQTIDMIDGNLVQSMKQGACLINTARGEIIIDNELVDVLQTRPDLTYVTDVLTGMTDGTQHQSKLFELYNVIVTPHVAGLTVESNEKALRIVNKLLWRWHNDNC
jgi:phosphoglycerate dehydrogenase-like enzyme